MDFSLDDLLGYMDEIINGDITDADKFNYWTGVKFRELWIEGEICAAHMDIVRKIQLFNRQDKDIPAEKRVPIVLHIMTWGGDLDVCNSIIDAINTSVTPVYGLDEGRALSAGAYIFISCHKRFMMPHSYLLFHQGSTESSGTTDFSTSKAAQAEWEYKVNELNNLVASHTKYPLKTIKQKIKTDWYVHAQDALDNGACDAVVSSIYDIQFPPYAEVKHETLVE